MQIPIIAAIGAIISDILPLSFDICLFSLSPRLTCLPPNGVHYPLVGETSQRRFDGTNREPRKLFENAQTPTSREYALLAYVSD